MSDALFDLPEAASSNATLVVEADGGSRGNPGPAAYGSLVRDPESGTILETRSGYLGHATNNVAEYTGVLEGLRAAFELNPNAKIVARLDSKLVVEQLSGRWKIKHPDMQALALQVHRLVAGRPVSYEWVAREKNQDADRLVNECLNRQSLS